MARWMQRFYAAALVALASAQSYDPRDDFCRRFSHEAAVVGDKLFINNGQLFLQGKGGKNFTNDRLLFHDLTTTELDGKELGMPILETNVSKPETVPNLIGGMLWADDANGKLFQFGGEWPGETVPADKFKTWQYDVYYNNWTELDTQDEISRVSFGAGTTVEHLGMGFYFGGYLSSRTTANWAGPRKASNMLVEYDMIRNRYQNRTAPDDAMGRAEGVLFYVPFGDRGMLVHFGGVKFDNEEDAEEEPSPMDEINIYDLGNQKWYTQSASGDVPELRRRFCGGVTTAQDGSSSNIYIYGGMGFGANVTGFDDAYILTIPTFQWVKIYPAKGTPRTKDQEFPHYDLSCTVIKNSQLLIIGGQFPRDMEAKNCDAPDVWGEHNLVMSKVKTDKESAFWGLFKPDRDKYEVPEDLINVIGGDAHGNAQEKFPANQTFDESDLQTLFRRTVEVTARTPTRTAPAAAGATGADDGPFSTPGKKAVILAPTIAGIIIIAAVAFFFIRRYRQHKRAINPPPDQPPTYKPRDSNAPESVGIQSPTQPGWGYPHGGAEVVHPQHTHGGAGFSSHTYSDYSGEPQTPARVMSPVELPHTHSPLPEVHGNDRDHYGAWSPPPPPHPTVSPVNTMPMSSGSVQGHFPPPLPEGYVPSRTPAMPEMQEREREKSDRLL